ncbi:serine/threonine-protein kinase [Streptomyces sp. SP17BM10]|uniref:serine/threonine-protein kinase n=1 Tax=Streptomyces sp. SP17BM10 TaxID=3002530 RepID=UPI002E77DA53|nr:serine/threonine-protein kinase [Streptomyces sp. SP17BM10]MEE1782741.1 serine/threonine-protein kinase [Streptomyces sp. SP17BM10]
MDDVCQYEKWTSGPIPAGLGPAWADWSHNPYLVVPLLLVVVAALLLRVLTIPVFMAHLRSRRARVFTPPGAELPRPKGAARFEPLLPVLLTIAVTGFLALAYKNLIPGLFGGQHCHAMNFVENAPWPFSTIYKARLFTPMPASSTEIAQELGVVLAIGWLLPWLLTQWIAVRVRMPLTAQESARSRWELVWQLAARVAVCLVLPFLVLACLIAWQLVSLIATGALLRAPARVRPAVSPQTVPLGAQAPVPVPFPTQPDAHAAAPVVPVIPCQPLRAHEPRAIGLYQLLGRIGAGGMGTVFLARRQGSATQVALKTLNPELVDDDDLRLRFEREAQVLAMVPGVYTARVLDTGLADGTPFIAMELLDGRPLEAYLREQGPIRSPEALRALALALAVALDGVHRSGLVHRDLKPANIMMTTAGPKLLDFGIAMIVDATRLTRTGGGPGTLTYMAPEQFGDGPIGPAADVWAWGCCVVCAAHGASPFAATSSPAVIRKIVEFGPEDHSLAAVRALDPGLAAVVERALARDASARPADGGALLALLAGQAVERTALDDQITRGWRTLVL